MLLKWDQTCSVMPVETSSGRSLSGCIIQQYSVPLPGKKKGLLNIWKMDLIFLFKCIDVEGRRGKNRNSASRCSLEGHQGKLPSFSYWSTGLLGCITWGRFGKVRYFEGLLTATTSWQIIDHFSFTNMSTSYLRISYICFVAVLVASVVAPCKAVLKS